SDCSFPGREEAMSDMTVAANGAASRSARDLIVEIVADIQEIIRSEVRLAKAEVKEEGARAGMAGAMFGAAGWVGLFALALLEGMGVVLWAMLTSLWIAFLIMSAISGLCAGIFYAVGRDRWRSVGPLPKTVTSLKEDVEWARSQTR